MGRPNLSARDLSQVVFCFLDVEATGLDPFLGDRICEIALLKTINGKEVEVFQSLVNPTRPISPGAYAINLISDEMVKTAPLFGDIAGKVLEFIEGTILVVHNAQSDLTFLSHQLNLSNLPSPTNLVIDTLKIARKYYRFPGNHLGTIAKCLNVHSEGQHRALLDVRTTKLIFDIFLEHFQIRGMERLDRLLQRPTPHLKFR